MTYGHSKHSTCAERTGRNEKHHWNVDLDASPVLPILDRIGRARSLRVLLAQHARVPHLVEENGQHPDRKGLRHIDGLVDTVIRDLVDPEEWANALDQKEHKA